MNPRPDGQTRIGDDSWVSVALFRVVVGGLLGAFASVVGGIFWASSVNGKLEAAVTTAQTAVAVQTKQGEDIAAIKDSVQGLNLITHDLQRDLTDQWKFSDTVWLLGEIQRLNPQMHMPQLGAVPTQMRTDGPRK